MHNILLFGPQGSGKGTQGQRLKEYLHLPLIVTGDIFRHNMKEGTELGKLAQEYINKGELVPDEVTNKMIEARLAEPDCQEGYILDGFPRSLAQATALDSFTSITHLLHITISDDEAVVRIENRRTCVDQGHVYHLLYNKPTKEGVCDIDGSELKQRDDDTAEALRTRLEIYHSETEPLLDHYRASQVVHDIDGTPPIDEVWEAVVAIFEKA